MEDNKYQTTEVAVNALQWDKSIMSERKEKGEERKEEFLEKNTIGYYRNKPVFRAFGRYMYVDDNGRSKPIPPSELKKWKEEQKEKT